MFGIKKDKRNIGDFYRELQDATNGKAYGIQLAELLFPCSAAIFRTERTVSPVMDMMGGKIFQGDNARR